VLKLKNAGIKAIFNTGYEGDMINMLKAMSRINYSVPVAVAEPDSITPGVIKEFSSSLKGTISFGFPPISKSFLAKLKKFDPSNSGKTLEAAAMAYTHIIQMVNALKSCPTDDIQCRVSSMERAEMDPTMSFVRWNNRIASYEFTLKKWQNGRLELIKTFN
jgi:ABC-type branched-subunit amino acid transport system substrate-binding protein